MNRIGMGSDGTVSGWVLMEVLGRGLTKFEVISLKKPFGNGVLHLNFSTPCM